MSTITQRLLKPALGLLAACAMHAGARAQEAPAAAIVNVEVGYSAMDPLLGRQRVWAVHRLAPGMLRETHPGDPVWVRIACRERRPCELEVLARAPNAQVASTDIVLTGVVMAGDDEGVIRAVRFDRPIEVRDDALFQQLAFQAGRIKFVAVGVAKLAGQWVDQDLRVTHVEDGQPIRWK